jgi:hypothetical protein
VVWSTFIEMSGGGYSQVGWMRFGSDRSVDASQALTPSNGFAGTPQVATDSQDRVLAVWVRSDGTNNRVQFSHSGDAVPPDTQIDSGPADGSTISDTSPLISFSGVPADFIDHFECKLDGLEFPRCGEPFTYGPLASGPHHFEVQAVDLNGNIDPTPATLDFTVAEPAAGQAAGQVASRRKCKKIKSHKRRKKCTKRAKSRRH